MKNKFRRSIGTNILIYFCAAVLFILILFPFYWIICTSFKETLDIYVIPPEFFPKKFDFTNYALAFTKYKVPVFFINSLKVTPEIEAKVAEVEALIKSGAIVVSDNGAGLIK